MRYVKPIDAMSKAEFQEAGGKAANLGELARLGFRVPGGFCVTGRSLDYVLESARLMPEIMGRLAGLDFDDYGAVEERSATIRGLIQEAPVPEDLFVEIQKQIHALKSPSGEDPFVAVRSSVAVKDSAISSFPGMMDTYHFILGEQQIVAHIRQCWASLYTARAVTRRHQLNVDHNRGVIAPVVQRMVNAEVAGVLFNANPITSSLDEMIIESNWGLGESVVSGEVNADYFVVVRSDPPTIKERKIQNKSFMVTLDRERGSGRKKYPLTGSRATESSLSDEQLFELAALGEKVEAVFKQPQDIEWAYEGGSLFVLQSRNIKGLRSVGLEAPLDR
jgi:pyruvate,water dikinase